MDELTCKYRQLTDAIIASQDVRKMQVLASADTWGFGQLAAIQPKTARKWIDKLEATEWCNYLSEGEATEIADAFVNQNGKSGPRWSYAEFEKAVDEMGGNMELAPYYNRYALWTTANMLYSDHARSLMEFIPEAELPKVIYKMAVEKLKDPDRHHFVRPYFGV